jgi:hypothetical protein
MGVAVIESGAEPNKGLSFSFKVAVSMGAAAEAGAAAVVVAGVASVLAAGAATLSSALAKPTTNKLPNKALSTVFLFITFVSFHQ